MTTKQKYKLYLSEKIYNKFGDIFEDKYLSNELQLKIINSIDIEFKANLYYNNKPVNLLSYTIDNPLKYDIEQGDNVKTIPYLGKYRTLEEFVEYMCEIKNFHLKILDITKGRYIKTDKILSFIT